MPKREVARAKAKASRPAVKAIKRQSVNPVMAQSPVAAAFISPAEEMEDAEYDEGVFDGLAALKDDD